MEENSFKHIKSSYIIWPAVSEDRGGCGQKPQGYRQVGARHQRPPPLQASPHRPLLQVGNNHREQLKTQN